MGREQENVCVTPRPENFTPTLRHALSLFPVIGVATPRRPWKPHVKGSTRPSAWVLVRLRGAELLPWTSVDGDSSLVLKHCMFVSVLLLQPCPPE